MRYVHGMCVSWAYGVRVMICICVYGACDECVMICICVYGVRVMGA